MERKHYGLELYRRGVAPRLVLSVGRFEVSRMRQINLPRMDELVALRDQTPAEERHFFVSVDSSGVRVDKANAPRWNTYGEALALRRLLLGDCARTVVVISTNIHLRRVALAFAKTFGDVPIEFCYEAVPYDHGSVRRDGWWVRPKDRRYVFMEAIKLAGYRIILTMPAWAVRRIFRLKQ